MKMEMWGLCNILMWRNSLFYSLAAYNGCRTAVEVTLDCISDWKESVRMRQRKVQRIKKILVLAFFFVFFLLFGRAFKLAAGLGEDSGSEQVWTGISSDAVSSREGEQAQTVWSNEEGEQGELADANENRGEIQSGENGESGEEAKLAEDNESGGGNPSKENSETAQEQAEPQTILEQMAESQPKEEKGFFARLFSDDKERFIIKMTDAKTEQEIPLEDFLVGALSANIDAAYEEETLKAQAVLLRGNCLLKMNGESTVEYEELDMAYINVEQMQMLWGNDFREKYKRIRQAVKDTQGVVAMCKNTILNGNFHAMSAGKTRSGEENFTDASYNYLQSVACDKNIEHVAFVQERTVKNTLVNELTVLERDSAGYVRKAMLNGKETGGEEVREALGLASSNFEVSKEENEIIVRTKGIGHGFGFDQCYANYKAVNESADYMALISYFFKEVSFTQHY